MFADTSSTDVDTDVLVNVTSGKLRILFEMPFGQRTNTFVSEILRAAEGGKRSFISYFCYALIQVSLFYLSSFSILFHDVLRNFGFEVSKKGAIITCVDVDGYYMISIFAVLIN